MFSIPPPMFLAELLRCGLPGLLASTSLTCQVSVAHLTFRLCFPSDNQILCVVWWLLQSFTATSAVIYTFLFIFYVAADRLVGALHDHPSPNPLAARHQSQIDLSLINTFFQNPCHVRPVTKGDVCCISVSNQQPCRDLIRLQVWYHQTSLPWYQTSFKALFTRSYLPSPIFPAVAVSYPQQQIKHQPRGH